jgi:hypothetical protein
MEKRRMLDILRMLQVEPRRQRRSQDRTDGFAE